MDRTTHDIGQDLGRLAEDARALIAATADIAGAKVTDAAIHRHPYQAIAIGVGVGALMGYLLARKSDRNGA